MSISPEAQTVQDKLTSKLQSLYNLNFKNRSNPPGFKKYESNGTEIVIYPNAIDYIRNGEVTSVKWEMVYDTHKVINVTLSQHSKLDEIDTFLRKYLWGTE